MPLVWVYCALCVLSMAIAVPFALFQGVIMLYGVASLAWYFVTSPLGLPLIALYTVPVRRAPGLGAD